jgi:hypothetical protein
VFTYATTNTHPDGEFTVTCGPTVVRLVYEVDVVDSSVAIVSVATPPFVVIDRTVPELEDWRITSSFGRSAMAGARVFMLSRTDRFHVAAGNCVFATAVAGVLQAKGSPPHSGITDSVRFANSAVPPPVSPYTTVNVFDPGFRTTVMMLAPILSWFALGVPNSRQSTVNDVAPDTVSPSQQDPFCTVCLVQE